MSVRTTHGASRGRVFVRRLIALAVLVGGLGALGWIGVSLVRGDSGVKPPDVKAPVTAPTLKIIFPEGFTREQMAERIAEVNQIAEQKRGITPRLSRRAYLQETAASALPATYARDKKARSLEGFLFPATYEFGPKTTTKQLVNQQLATFRRNWAKVDLRFARSKNLTPFDVLIIASLIEKEVIAPEERALVASVIYNRLKRGMTLGIDATTRYALNVPPTEPLRVSQLNDPHPYNTRVNPGLPPGPIANPGLASMQAAAHPKQTDFLFFVRKPDKVHHKFSRTQEEHDAYQRQFGN